MVKNEAAVLQRCLSAARPFVDAVFLFDTGSDDATVAVAEQEGCSVVRDVWLDFGRSRTASLKAARLHVVRNLAWRLLDTYALVLDADMVLRGDAAAFRSFLDRALHAETSSLCITQQLGSVHYHNTRLMRLVDAWWCKGATHEYWTGGRSNSSSLLLDRELVWIEDLGDGGCKQDKYERDERLLRAALAEEPGDARSLFYLAQTYKDSCKYHEAIEAYQRRIDAGGWLEEVWYSHYGIVQCLVQIGDLPGAARKVKEAAEVCRDRVEAAMCLVQAFRLEGGRLWMSEQSELPPQKSVALFKKAWRYLERCCRLPLPSTERLFVEPAAYTSRLQLEKSYLAYYGSPRHPVEGLLAALSCEGIEETEALLNAVHYVQPLLGVHWKRLAIPAPEGFKSSSVGHSEGLLCVRCVNYTILPDGSYAMSGGKVETRNFLVAWKGFDVVDYLPSELMELVPGAPPVRPDETILGLEDVRLFDTTCFTATTREFSYGPFSRIAWGEHRREGDRAVASFTILHPPSETVCEKNWIPLDPTHFIYRWHPLEIYRILEPESVQCSRSQATPRWFRHVRGSTPFVSFESRRMGLVHIVLPHAPRVYLHAFVWLSEDWTLVAYSLPFVLREVGIEYSLGLAVVEDRLVIFASSKDCESWMGAMELSACAVLAVAWP